MITTFMEVPPWTATKLIARRKNQDRSIPLGHTDTATHQISTEEQFPAYRNAKEVIPIPFCNSADELTNVSGQAYTREWMFESPDTAPKGRCTRTARSSAFEWTSPLGRKLL